MLLGKMSWTLQKVKDYILHSFSGPFGSMEALTHVCNIVPLEH